MKKVLNKKNNRRLHSFVVLAYKESPYLEDCIKSTLKQSIKSDIIIATTSDNKYIRAIARKYNLNVVVGNHTTFGGDFDFARLSVNSQLLTIAHQDDFYDRTYVETIIQKYKESKNASIIFPDYYEIRNNKKIFKNKNLNIKRLLLAPLRVKHLGKFKFFKRLSICFGNSICCPAVTFVNDNCPKKVFTSEFKSNCDWFAWEMLSKTSTDFVYIPIKLVGHRIDESSTTTDIINNGIRTKEDLEILKKFWPSLIANAINKMYIKSESSNKL